MACELDTSLGAKPKSTDTKTNLIYKRAFRNYLYWVHDWFFASLYFPPPIWCTNGGLYRHAIILAPS